MGKWRGDQEHALRAELALSHVEILNKAHFRIMKGYHSYMRTSKLYFFIFVGKLLRQLLISCFFDSDRYREMTDRQDVFLLIFYIISRRYFVFGQSFY